MLTIGLTGGIGSGKSTVAKLFAERGIPIIDTDLIAREVVAKDTHGFKKIIEIFGNEIVNTEGEIDRKNLKNIIFNDQEKRQVLEEILHPLIREEVGKRIKKIAAPYCIVVIPLLFETAPNPLINRVLVVDTTVENQIKRTSERDNISNEQVQKIMNMQVERDVRLKGANEIIENNTNFADLEQQVERFHRYYLSIRN